MCVGATGERGWRQVVVAGARTASMRAARSMAGLGRGDAHGCHAHVRQDESHANLQRRGQGSNAQEGGVLQLVLEAAVKGENQPAGVGATQQRGRWQWADAV